MANYWQNFVYKFFQYAPSLVVCLCFLPCGLIYGYTLSSFVAERNIDIGVIKYGPMILGACWGLVVALAMFLIKFLKGRIIFWHMNLLLVAGAFNLISSCFYFANGFDDVGAFISYLAHSLSFIAGLSFLHSIPGKCSRTVLLTLCFAFYFLGTASAVSLIGSSYTKNLQKQPQQNATAEQITDGIYVNFAGVYLSIAAVVLAVLIGLKVLTFLGNVDCENSMDDELRIANSNGSIFDKRQDVLKRIQFFYVTKNQQWNVMLLLIFTEAIQYALFVYFIFWFALNGAIGLTSPENVDIMLWIVFVGAVGSIISLLFVSVKINFVASQLCLLVLTVLSMIIASSTHSTATFWLILLFFGFSYSNLQICIVEMSHFRFTELFIYISYVLKLLITSIVYYYFVYNGKNSYFYSTDESTLMAQGFVFIIITALIALVVGMKVPRTHRMTLFEIKYELLGIIFQKHQIEQLNVKWLNDGTIPTISQPDD